MFCVVKPVFYMIELNNYFVGPSLPVRRQWHLPAKCSRFVEFGRGKRAPFESCFTRKN